MGIFYSHFKSYLGNFCLRLGGIYFMIVLSLNIGKCMWDVEYTDEFGEWWDTLSEDEQSSLRATVKLLQQQGVKLGYPHSSGIHSSRHSHMRELRTQINGRPFRTLYAFDPRRTAILLIAGDKTGNKRWYDIYIPIADDLYDEHLMTLSKEGLL